MTFIKNSLLLLLFFPGVCLVGAYIPDDAAIKWPSPATVAAFGRTLDGEVFFPESEGYVNGTAMMNTRWNSAFGVVAMVKNTGR